MGTISATVSCHVFHAPSVVQVDWGKLVKGIILGSYGRKDQCLLKDVVRPPHHEAPPASIEVVLLPTVLPQGPLTEVSYELLLAS